MREGRDREGGRKGRKGKEIGRREQGVGKREVRKGERGLKNNRGWKYILGVGVKYISPLVTFPGLCCKPGNETGNKQLYFSHCRVSWPNCKSCLPFLGGWAVKTVWGQGKSRDMSYTPKTPLDVPTARHCVCGREKNSY